MKIIKKQICNPTKYLCCYKNFIFVWNILINEKITCPEEFNFNHLYAQFINAKLS